MDTTQFNVELTTGAQPTADDLATLKQNGFATVVNVRNDGEENQPLSVAEEGCIVEELGMTYAHFPVGGDNLTPEMVDDFRRQYELLPKPIYVHCHKGTRAGALGTMEWATQRGLGGKLALEQAERMGFSCKSQPWRELIETYVDRQASSSTET